MAPVKPVDSFVLNSQHNTYKLKADQVTVEQLRRYYIGRLSIDLPALIVTSSNKLLCCVFAAVYILLVFYPRFQEVIFIGSSGIEGLARITSLSSYVGNTDSDATMYH